MKSTPAHIIDIQHGQDTLNDTGNDEFMSLRRSQSRSAISDDIKTYVSCPKLMIDECDRVYLHSDILLEGENCYEFNNSDDTFL